MSALGRFQDWYLAQCDGKWEGDRGITVGILDGPGWRVSVSLTDTYLENAGFEEFIVECLEDDWAHARVVESTESACHHRFETLYGPRSPTRALETFLDWAEPPEG